MVIFDNGWARRNFHSNRCHLVELRRSPWVLGALDAQNFPMRNAMVCKIFNTVQCCCCAHFCFVLSLWLLYIFIYYTYIVYMTNYDVFSTSCGAWIWRTSTLFQAIIVGIQAPKFLRCVKSQKNPHPPKRWSDLCCGNVSWNPGLLDFSSSEWRDITSRWV